jgi:hypothetical protein
MLLDRIAGSELTRVDARYFVRTQIHTTSSDRAGNDLLVSLETPATSFGKVMQPLRLQSSSDTLG